MHPNPERMDHHQRFKVKTMYDYAHEAGIEKGKMEFMRDLLEERFGPLPRTMLARLESMSATQIKGLMPRALKAASFGELGLEE